VSAQVTHDKDGAQIVPLCRLREVLAEAGETCYCAPDEPGIEWDAGACPEHGECDDEECEHEECAESRAQAEADRAEAEMWDSRDEESAAADEEVRS